jgi:hypothetical protein
MNMLVLALAALALSAPIPNSTFLMTQRMSDLGTLTSLAPTVAWPRDDMSARGANGVVIYDNIPIIEVARKTERGSNIIVIDEDVPIIEGF